MKTLDLETSKIMKAIDFTYYCVFAMVPDKATLGKKTVAATLHSSMSSFFYFALVFWVDFVIRDFQIVSAKSLLIIVVLIFGGHFIFNWRYFLREEKQIELAGKYGHLKKWKLKLMGASFLLLCFFFFIFSMITMSILRQYESYPSFVTFETIKSQLNSASLVHTN